jgi:hypothetical protein
MLYKIQFEFDSKSKFINLKDINDHTDNDIITNRIMMIRNGKEGKK